MRIVYCSVAIILPVFLGACGDDSSEEAGGIDASADAVGTKTERATKWRCPAKIASEPFPHIPTNATVQNLRLGMTLNEVEATIRCEHPGLSVTKSSSGFQIKTYTEDAEIRQTLFAANTDQSSYGIADDPGEKRFDTMFMGMPGEERLYGVRYMEIYESGKRPTVETLKKALTDKYGQTEDALSQNNQYRNSASYSWFYQVDGKQVGRNSFRSSSSRSSCAQPHLRSNIGVSNQAIPGCGLIISASTEGAADNPSLARGVYIAIYDQNSLVESLSKIQEGFDEREQARRDAETEDAGNTSVDL